MTKSRARRPIVSARRRTDAQSNLDHDGDAAIGGDGWGEARVEIEKHEFHAGPLPPADELAAYGRVWADAPAEIVLMAKREQEHRHRFMERQQDLQEQQLDLQREELLITRRGQWLSATIAVLSLAATTGLILMGMPVASLVALIPALATIATAYMGRSDEKVDKGASTEASRAAKDQ